MGPREVGNPPHSLLPPPRPPDPSQFKSKVLAHKEEIAERFNKLSQSMTAFATEQERFRCELREELRQLRLSYSNPSTTTVSTSSSSLIIGNPSSPNYCQLPEPPPIPNCKPQPQIPDPTPPASFPLTQAVTNPTYAHIVTATTPPQTSPSKLGALDVCKDENHDVSCLPNIATSTIQNSVPSTPFNSADATLGRHLARRFDQIGVTDVFSVPDDFNLTLLDHLIAEPGLTNIGCCNEFNAGYAADGYRSSRTVGACVGGLNVLNAIAGAYNENLPVICIVGGPNSNDYKTNIIRHHTIGLPDFRQELRCFQNVTCFQVVVNNLEDAHELIDTAISISLKESKLVYISIGCYLAGIPHPTFSLEHVPFSLSPKLSDKMGLEAAVEVAAEFLNKAGKPVMVGEPKLRVALVGDVVVELADASGFTLAVMPSAKGMVPKHHPHFIGTYWGAVSTAFYAEFVESADAYLFAWPIFNDYSFVGYSLLLKKEKVIIVQPNSVTIRNGPTFGCVLIKDFRGGLAKRLKHNNATHENCHRIFVPDGHPLKAAPKEPLRVNVMFQHIQMMLSAETAVIAETGDSWFNCQKLKLPPGCGYEFQMQYGSIGWSIGAALGYTKVVPEKQVISFISDGSFQVTTQDVSTMIRMGQRTIIFLINNGGYTIEVEIHDGPYNVIKNWNYTVFVDAIHNERPFINKLVGKMEGAYFAAKFSLVELLAIFISTQKTTLKQIHPLGLNTDVDLIIFPPANFNLFVYEANINLDLDVVMHALSSFRKCKETRSSYYRNNGDKGMLLYKSFNQDEIVLLRWMFASSGLEDRDLLLALLKQNLHKAQERMKLFYDKRHRERTFQIGDWVYLLLQSYKQQAVEKRKVNKLSAKYYGHFEVIERMGTVAYKFKHSASARIHPAKVIDIMLEKGKGQALAIWLIQWIGAPVESATREFAQGMQILNVEVEVLQLKLEDKLFFKVGRVVRDQNY